MNRISRTFRQYHRKIAIAACIPLLLTVFTGMGYTILGEWLQLYPAASFVMSIHTGRIVGLQGIYPLLNGLGLVGLLVTGITMTRLLSSSSR